MVVIDVKGDIISNAFKMMYDWFGQECFTPKDLAQAMKNSSENEEITLNIASNGGDVFAASEIYSVLKAAKQTVTVNIQGLAASAASVIAMAGDVINISPTAQIMIHKAWSQPAGNADDLEHEAAILKGIDESIAAAYGLKTGMNQTDILHLMSKETWLTAQEAVDRGFADNILFVDTNQSVFSNSVGKLPSIEKLNEFMNFMNFRNRNKKTEAQIIKENKQADLRQRKLAILLEK